jgi:DNA-binding CsgD family transcriptional regulator
MARRIAISNISKTMFLASVRMSDRDNHSEPTELCERHPTIWVVVLSDPCHAMLGALQQVFGGNVSAEIFTREDASTPQPKEKQPAISHSGLSTSDLGLTERQLDVLALMMQGRSNKAICRVLNLAEPTVKNHVTAILKALRVSNRTEAVIAVGELGWKRNSICNRESRSNSNVAASAVP